MEKVIFECDNQRVLLTDDGQYQGWGHDLPKLAKAMAVDYARLQSEIERLTCESEHQWSLLQAANETLKKSDAENERLREENKARQRGSNDLVRAITGLLKNCTIAIKPHFSYSERRYTDTLQAFLDANGDYKPDEDEGQIRFLLNEIGRLQSELSKK